MYFGVKGQGVLQAGAMFLCCVPGGTYYSLMFSSLNSLHFDIELPLRMHHLSLLNDKLYFFSV